MKIQFLAVLLFFTLNECSQDVTVQLNVVPVRKVSTNWQQRCDYEKDLKNRRKTVNVAPAPQPLNQELILAVDPCDEPFIVLRYQFCQGYAGINQSEHNEMDMIRYLYAAEILNALPVHLLDSSDLHCSYNQDEVVQDPRVLASYVQLETLRVGQSERYKSRKLLKLSDDDL